MIRDADFDRILTGWLSEGPERAPAHDVAAALDVVASTPQRRSWTGPVGWRQWTRPLTRTRLGLIVAALLLIIAAVALGVGAGLIRLPSVFQEPTPPVPSDISLRPVQIADWPVKLSIPGTWTEIGGPCCDYRHFAGTTPEGHVSVGHESPYTTAVCSPDCQTIDLPMTIPYDAEAQLGVLKQAVGAIAGSSEWTLLESGVLDQITGAARLETTALDQGGREWRRVHIVGLRERNIVAIAWSQPADDFDTALLDAVLATVELTPAPVYSDGDLIDQFTSGSDYRMPMPGFWTGGDQPLLDGTPMSGVHRFADGRVIVSFGDSEGTIGLCDPDCRLLRSQTSLDAFDQSIRDGRRITPASVPTELGGEPRSRSRRRSRRRRATSWRSTTSAL